MTAALCPVHGCRLTSDPQPYCPVCDEGDDPCRCLPDPLSETVRLSDACPVHAHLLTVQPTVLAEVA